MANEHTGEKYLLVSDSNETANQYDSKKLSESQLVELAQDSLFKKSLDMSRYLTVQEYRTYHDILDQIPTEKPQFGNWRDKFRVVHGQVILLRAADVDRESSSPLQYLRNHWHITPEYRVMQLQDCMLRGMTEMVKDHKEKTQLPNNSEVAVSEENLPPHMHHSSIDMASGLQTMKGGSSEKVGFMDKEFRYDMFYNESFSTGVDKNELDGVVDKFEVQDSGTETDGTISHNNMPAHDRFYAFVIYDTTV